MNNSSLPYVSACSKLMACEEHYSCLQVKTRCHICSLLAQRGTTVTAVLFSVSCCLHLSAYFVSLFSFLSPWIPLFSLSSSHCVSSLFLPVNICQSHIKLTFCRLSEYAVGLIGSYNAASVSYWYAILMQIGSTGVMRERESGTGREEWRKERICPLNKMNRHFKYLHIV